MPTEKYQYKRLALAMTVLLCLFVVALIAVARVRTIVRNPEARTKTSSFAPAAPILDDKPERKQIEPAMTYQPALGAGSSSLPLPTFVAPGFHAALESASSIKNGPIQAVTLTAVNRGPESLEVLDVLLLDFTPQGTISRMEKRVLPLKKNSDRKQALYFESSMPRDPLHAQILAIAGVTSETKKQDIDIKDLAKALTIEHSQGVPPGLAIAEKAKSKEGSSNACFDWFKLVHDVARDQSSVVSGSSCNQSEQSFATLFVAPNK